MKSIDSNILQPSHKLRRIRRKFTEGGEFTNDTNIGIDTPALIKRFLFAIIFTWRMNTGSKNRRKAK